MKQMGMLFGVQFYISAFAFGGGYIVIPMMRREFVDKRGLLTEEELLDMAAIAQSAPGAIAVSLSVLVGYHIGGVKGVVVSCIGTLLPPLCLLSVISAGYGWFQQNTVVAAVLKGMEAGVAAAIADLLTDMAAAVVKEKNPLTSLLMPAAFIGCFVFNIHVAWIIAACVASCLVQIWIRGRRMRRHG